VPTREIGRAPPRPHVGAAGIRLPGAERYM